jgi:ABC-type lipoprotein export system ATPase subunit
MNDIKGSHWHKWDLHVHTPASITHEYGGNSDAVWEKFISALEALPEEIKVIGVNDYIFIDGYRRVFEAKQAGRLGNIDLILPVVELRLDKFGGTKDDLSKVNFHVIFSNQVEPNIIEQHFLNALTRHYQLTPVYQQFQSEWKALPTRDSLIDLGERIIQSVPASERHNYHSPIVEGFNNICFNIEDIRGALDSHYFRDKCLTAVGKTEWWNVKWTEQSVAEKKNIINAVDFVFISAQSMPDCHKARKQLQDALVNFRLLDCSDAHRFSNAAHKDRLGKCYSWIKADTTFDGLNFALYEYDGRVYLGDKPDKIRETEANKTKYIRSVAITKKPESDFADEVWFENSQIELNHDLVAVIGNKGTGKSALSDVLGLLGNTRNDEKFSFLGPQRFRVPNNNKSQHFHATLVWESGLTITRGLDELTDHNLLETIKYIPQGLFEDICNEIASGAETNFDRELRKVIFSHVEVADRLGKETLDDLLAYRTEETYSAIAILKSRLNEINEHIFDLEEQLTDENRMQLENLLDTREKELAAHANSKPQPVLMPQDAIQQANHEILTAITQLNGQMKSLQATRTGMQNLQEGSALLVSVADKVLGRITNFQRQFDDFQSDCFPELEQLGLHPEEIINLSVNPSPVLEKRNYHDEQRGRADHLLDPKAPASIVNQIERVRREIDALQDKLDEPNREYQRCQSALRDWEHRQKEITGDFETVGSLEYYRHQLAELNRLPERLEASKTERLTLVKDVYSRIKNLAETYRSLYQPVQQFIDSHAIARDELKLNFDVSVVNTSLHERLFDWIGHNVMGSFYGRASGEKTLRGILERHTFDTEGGVLAFLQELMEHLTFDKRMPNAPPMKIAEQLKKGQTVTSLYNYIFSLDYLRPRYILKLADKELSQLSPGERGALLLIFYLLIDKENIPLVIDQPEENLDNQTVYRLLVKCIKETKNRRQIIIVTHNPNLAVVCDAEQIICCSIDKLHGNRIEYVSGAIENPVINKRIVDTLEGTKPAFDNRKLKYQPFAALVP